jgi:hypothetical protein
MTPSYDMAMKTISLVELSSLKGNKQNKVVHLMCDPLSPICWISIFMKIVLANCKLHPQV